MGVREERNLSELAVYEIRSQLARVATQAEFYARRASRKGLWIAFTCELSWLDGAARLALGFRVQKGEVEADKAERALRKRITLVEKLLSRVCEKLREEGVEVQVDKHANLVWGSYPLYASVEAVVRPVKVEEERFLGVKGRRWRVVGDSETWVGGVRTSELKALEAEVELEGEVPEAVASGEVAQAPEGKWIRLHEAVLKYGVPLAVLSKLAEEGKIQSHYDVDEKGKPALYVNEEEVKKIVENVKGGT